MHFPPTLRNVQLIGCSAVPNRGTSLSSSSFSTCASIYEFTQIPWYKMDLLRFFFPGTSKDRSIYTVWRRFGQENKMHRVVWSARAVLQVSECSDGWQFRTARGYYQLIHVPSPLKIHYHFIPLLIRTGLDTAISIVALATKTSVAVAKPLLDFIKHHLQTVNATKLFFSILSPEVIEEKGPTLGNHGCHDSNMSCILWYVWCIICSIWKLI